MRDAGRSGTLLWVLPLAGFLGRPCRKRSFRLIKVFWIPKPFFQKRFCVGVWGQRPRISPFLLHTHPEGGQLFAEGVVVAVGEGGKVGALQAELAA